MDKPNEMNEPNKVEKKRRLPKLPKIGTMNLILIIIAIALTIFTAIMIWLFILYQYIPDTLCTCVFAALTGEAGAMAWIKTTKEKKVDREWELEDRKSGNNVEGGDEGNG